MKHQDIDMEIKIKNDGKEGRQSFRATAIIDFPCFKQLELTGLGVDEQEAVRDLESQIAAMKHAVNKMSNKS